MLNEQQFELAPQSKSWMSCSAHKPACGACDGALCSVNKKVHEGFAIGHNVLVHYVD